MQTSSWDFNYVRIKRSFSLKISLNFAYWYNYLNKKLSKLFKLNLFDYILWDSRDYVISQEWNQYTSDYLVDKWMFYEFNTFYGADEAHVFIFFLFLQVTKIQFSSDMWWNDSNLILRIWISIFHMANNSIFEKIFLIFVSLFMYIQFLED